MKPIAPKVQGCQDTKMSTPSIEQAHIDADEHARRCDDENCEWCDYDSSDVDYGVATPSA